MVKNQPIWTNVDCGPYKKAKLAMATIHKATHAASTSQKRRQENLAWDGVGVLSSMSAGLVP